MACGAAVYRKQNEGHNPRHRHAEEAFLAAKPPPPHERLSRLAVPGLEFADRSIYALAGILLLFAATAMGVYSCVTFIKHLNDDFPLDLITFINDLLLVLIILEVLGTVRSYLETGTTSLEPFLYIGIISATRRILAIGAQTTLGEVKNESFDHLMIDLGVNGGVVLALAVALFLFTRRPGNQAPAEASPRAD